MSSLYQIVSEKEPRKVPIVFYHGFFLMPSIWNEVLANWSPDASVAQCLLPGHGPSPVMPADALFYDLVKMLAREIPFSRPAHLIGYSMGARIALALSLWFPERVSSAVLIGVNPGLTQEKERQERTLWDLQHAEMIEKKGVLAFADYWQSLPIFHTQKTLSSSKKAQLRQERALHTQKGLSYAMKTLGLGHMPSLWNLLAKSPKRFCFLAGGQDKKFLTISQKAARVSPFGKEKIIINAGHNVVLEVPKTLAGLLQITYREFLQTPQKNRSQL